MKYWLTYFFNILTHIRGDNLIKKSIGLPTCEGVDLCQRGLFDYHLDKTRSLLNVFAYIKMNKDNNKLQTPKKLPRLWLRYVNSFCRGLLFCTKRRKKPVSTYEKKCVA